ncbi:hypothetical protein RHGRI_011641 [Rhododendron griersonianum]|uniref:Chloroplast lumen common family protein n=1 Tax=Rhododendron griersonianum TaxID=479676 RepID=A0AAV6KN29_9ERIC|nr:hypothetical protein RHGRI_011641 [Rhododendron griersonianum]
MEAVSKIHHRHQPLHDHRPPFSTPISLLFARSPPPPPSSLRSSVRAKPSSPLLAPLLPNPKTNKPYFAETPNPHPFSLVKTITLAAVAATAVFFARFNLQKPLVAAAFSPPPTVETAAMKESISDGEKERGLKKYLSSNPDDIKTLRSLMELKIKRGKLKEAISIVEKLISLEPTDIEWALLKSYLHLDNEELEKAKIGFNEILEKDPSLVEAYHGLVMAASQSDSEFESKEIEERVREVMDLCKRDKRKDKLRDFKLLIAQMRVIEGNYNDALSVYQELVKEEPSDFRPYLCQGIIYTLLKKEDEAEKHFQKYRRLVPKGHPYAQYFDDNMIATKVLAQTMENERAASKA